MKTEDVAEVKHTFLTEFFMCNENVKNKSLELGKEFDEVIQIYGILMFWRSL